MLFVRVTIIFSQTKINMKTKTYTLLTAAVLTLAAIGQQEDWARKQDEDQRRNAERQREFEREVERQRENGRRWKEELERNRQRDQERENQRHREQRDQEDDNYARRDRRW